MAEYIIAIDPSGAFYEGTGTTGWCVMDQKRNVLSHGYIWAGSYTNAYAYYTAHIIRLQQLMIVYKDCAIVIEDYLLYGNAAASQINSRMETVQLIGILKYKCLELFNIEPVMQTASMVKQRWADRILLLKEIILEKRGKYYVPGDEHVINEHSLDAIRHAAHYVSFKNREDEL